MARTKFYRGLNDKEVEESRRRNGPNVLTPAKKESWLKLFLEKFNDPLIIILLVVGIFAVGVSAYEYWGLHQSFTVFFEPIGIFVAILLATGLGFYFELKAQKEFNLLNQENDKELVTVVRNRNVMEIPKCDVVVGDILILQTGQEVPADATLIEAVNLSVDESSLTGEPVHQKSVDVASQEASTYPCNRVYRGTQIMEGHGIAEVFAVGDYTENGRIMQSIMGVEIDEDDVETDKASDGLNETQRKALKLKKKNKVQKKVRTPLNLQLGRLGRLITNISYVFAGAIIAFKLMAYFEWTWWISLLIALLSAAFFWLVIKKFPNYGKWQCLAVIIVFFVLYITLVIACHNYAFDKDYSHLISYSLNTIMIAVTLVVVAVPEGLPMAITLSLANSMRKMLKTNNLVRKMHACETMGAATVICTDKTGTLTQNQMQVRETLLEGGEMAYEAMAVNSTASLDFSDTTRPKVVGNPTEGALLLWLHGQGKDYMNLRDTSVQLQEIPFTTDRKYMATLVVSGVRPGTKILYVKGAPEIVMSLCSDIEGNHTREEYEQKLKEYQLKAMRTLGFAYMIVDDDIQAICNGKLVAKKLVFMGIVGIEDPIREDVKDAVEKCMKAGIKVKIITGDNLDTAREIARQIGVWTDSCTDYNAIDGAGLAALTDEELKNRANDLIIIARARPMDKKRFVEALQRNGHVVAVTGDGTNDAPALNAAHVGLSMGAGTSVAKEASDITILDNSFVSIVRAVEWGRALFMNIQRFLLFQLTVNVAACMLVLAGAVMGFQSPLTVSQMLWVNLIMDTFAAFALSALPPDKKIMKDQPRNHRAFILDKSMRTNIFGVGMFFFLMLVGLWFVFQHSDITQLTDLLHFSIGNKREVQSYELTLLFTIFVMTHFWYMFNARAFKTGGSGLNLRGCDGFIIIAVIIFVGQILIVQVPVLNSFFNVMPLKPKDWGIIILLSSLVLWVRELYSLCKNPLKKRLHA